MSHAEFPVGCVSGVALIHADESLLVLDKPAGLLSVPGRGEDRQDCLSARVRTVFPEAQIVHRLDMATSGLMLMALGTQAQRMLNMAFARREVRKRYVAVVSGMLPPADGADGWGEIDLPLMPDWPHRPRSKVDFASGKPSLTRWRVLAHEFAGGASLTRVELEPVTGRSHQLRVHLQALGHPIVGDTLYAPPQAPFAAARMLLHASALRLKHPVSDNPLSFDSPVPF